MTADFKSYLQDYNYAAVRLTCILCAVLMPAGFLLDLLTNRQFVGEFLVLRMLAAAISLGVLGLSRLRSLRRHSYILISLVILACTGAIELMILRLGSASSSPYYAGLNLCILGAGLVYVWSARQALGVCAMVLLLWLGPALWGHPNLYGPFFNNLYFLVLTSIIAVAANAMRYNQAHREWEAKSALSRTSAELQTSIERIQELDRLKNQFFTNISHELRTPLALITAPIEEMLSRHGLPDVHRNALQVVLRNGLRLHRLIDGLLDLARLEAGQLRLRVINLDMAQLLQSVVAAFQPAADSMGIKLELSVPDGDGPSSLMGDSEKLEVVLTNLLGNSLKFTERGGLIHVELRYLSGAVEIDIRDSGQGIPESEQPFIFERFRRVESAGRKQGGAGIGLALVKELVELHGGSVSVKSRPGEGATFTVRLKLGNEHLRDELIDSPSQPPSSPQLDLLRPGSAQQALVHVDGALDPRLEPANKGNSSQAIPVLATGGGFSRAHVLIAEDNVDLRKFLQELLAPYYSVTVACDGKAALDSIHERMPDLVLADVMMPQMSGIELCQQVKRDLRTRTLPVILLTARSGIDETIEGFSHGADDYLVKPFSPRELLMRVAVQLKLRRLTAQVANAARLAAVGTLAAGVAHEIKNPLNAINTGAAALRKRDEMSPALVAEILDMMEECVGRISEITTALTEHARPADGEGLSLFDVQKGLDTTLRLLADRLRGSSIQIIRDFRTERLIVARPRQLNQVFLNLLDNAVRASPQGGRISLTLSETDRDTLSLVVHDEGPGVPIENRERIFDPFFTTRAPGEGTGLGLYLSRQIIEAHGGSLRVGSVQGRGAAFIVDLPVSGPIAQSSTSGKQGAAA
jgi:signal transduction histidine kinase